MRAEAIERTAQVVANMFKHPVYKDCDQITALREALAMPKDAEPVAWIIQSVDRHGKAYTDISPVKPSEGMMGTIMRDFAETKLTPLYTQPPKSDPRRAELVKRIDYLLTPPSCYEVSPMWRDTIKNIRDYLEGAK